jgi:opacity protein-like surface antigen
VGKKILIVLLLWVFSGEIFAAATPYLGFRLGLNTGNWKLVSPSGAATYFGSNGQMLEVLGGISYPLANSFSLAAEIFAGDSSTQTANKILDDNTTTLKMRSTYSYGLSVVPGYSFGSDMTVYARMGVVKTHFATTEIPGGQANYSPTGAQAGCGIAISLSAKLALRGEYIYSNYQTFKLLDNKISPTSNQLSVGFVYKIA